MTKNKFALVLSGVSDANVSTAIACGFGMGRFLSAGERGASLHGGNITAKGRIAGLEGNGHSQSKHATPENGKGGEQSICGPDGLGPNSHGPIHGPSGFSRDGPLESADSFGGGLRTSRFCG